MKRVRRITASLIAFAITFCVVCSPLGAHADSTNPTDQLYLANNPGASLPTSGTPSPDVRHGSGLYNVGASKTSLSPGLVSAQNLSTTGLIAVTALDIYAETNKVEIDGFTDCNGDMAEVGFKGLQLQRWNGSSWVTVFNKSMHSNNTWYYEYDQETSVTPGYLYRVVGTHYAIQYWLFIPYEQDMYNESDYVYVG